MGLSTMKLQVISFLGSIKVIYWVILIVLIIAVEIVWAYKTISVANPLTGKSQIQTPLASQREAANLIALAVAKNEFKVGENIPVTINIVSKKTTAGADLIIKYDPNLLLVITGKEKTPVAVGGLYDNYPVNQVDEKNGIITVSGITNNISGTTPNGVFGTVTFQGKAVGTARVFLEFTKNTTNDTNLIENETVQDVLEEVRNLDLKITP